MCSHSRVLAPVSDLDRGCVCECRETSKEVSVTHDESHDMYILSCDMYTLSCDMYALSCDMYNHVIVAAKVM